MHYSISNFAHFYSIRPFPLGECILKNSLNGCKVEGPAHINVFQILSIFFWVLFYELTSDKRLTSTQCRRNAPICIRDKPTRPHFHVGAYVLTFSADALPSGLRDMKEYACIAFIFARTRTFSRHPQISGRLGS